MPEPGFGFGDLDPDQRFEMFSHCYTPTMSRIRLIISDIDGTLVPSLGSTLTAETLDAVTAVKAAGVRFCLVTGRPYAMTLPIIAALGVSDLVVCEGGSEIIDPRDGSVVWQKRLGVEATRGAVRLLCPVAVRLYVGVEQEDVRNLDPKSFREGVSQVWASVPANQADQVSKALEALPEVVVHKNSAPGGDKGLCGLHITHREADKYHAVQQLLKMEAVPKMQIMALGDGDNDIPLFQNAGLKVAVGRSSRQLCHIADDIVPAVEEGGFITALQRHVLNARAGMV